MANIILPEVNILNEINDSATMLVEQNGEINRFNIADLDIGGGDVTIDLEDSNISKPNPVNADTLGGCSPEEYAKKNELEEFINNRINSPKAGFIYPLASSTVPEGFLLCDGAEYGREEYPELFAAIGTIYGEGDGSTTFNVPNLQTRVPVGAGEGYELGSIGGEATHTLTVDEMPKHKHWYNSYQQGYPINFTNAEQYRTPVTKMDDSREETTNYSNTDSNYTGGSQPHNNMQPYTVVNYIIATGRNTGVSISDIILGAQTFPLEVQYGGTGASNAEDARVNLGIDKYVNSALENKLSMELLWENASPTSDFGEQNVSLNTKGVSCAIVVFRYDTTYATQTSWFVPYELSQVVKAFAGASESYRSVGLYENRMWFSNARDVSDISTNNNTKCIPTRIYLIKGESK